MKNLMLILTLLCLSCCAIFKVCTPKLVTPYAPFLYDNSGRIVLYHGVNISNSSKDGPTKIPWHQEEDFKRLNDWGFNFVRYLIFWSAIEPTQNHYDTAYMLSTIVRLKQLKSLGIDVVVDIHQDLYAEKFGGDGFPGWTINDKGIPFTLRAPWNLNYLESAVLTTFDGFWKSDSLKQKYIDMLKFVLSQFDSLILGIDVMNEPFPGTSIKFEQKILTEFYYNIQDMMKQNRFKSKMFFEPWMCTSSGIPSLLKFKPDSALGVYFPHYYDALVHECKPYTATNKELMKTAVQIKVSEAQKFGSPFLYGEFAIQCHDTQFYRYLDDFLALADEHFIGWTYYSYDKGNIIDDEKTIDPYIMPRLIRPYPQRIAGINPTLEYKDKTLCLTYDARDLAVPTIVFIPESLKNVLIKINGNIRKISGNILNYNASSGKQEILVTWN